MPNDQTTDRFRDPLRDLMGDYGCDLVDIHARAAAQIKRLRGALTEIAGPIPAARRTDPLEDPAWIMRRIATEALNGSE